MDTKLLISCLCGEFRQQVSPREGDGVIVGAEQELCHCDTCRYTSGVLCTSYLPVEKPDTLDGLAPYITSPKSTRYFCNTCGTHLFRSTASSYDRSAPDEESRKWEAATGTIVDSPEEETAPAADDFHWKHLNIADTKDGGVSSWINNNTTPKDTPKPASEPPHSSAVPSSTDGDGSTVPGSCHCGTVRFHLTRPDAASQLPTSGFSDLMAPFCRTDPEVVKNPADTKWWLRAANTKYLAGTCACRTCRLATGFEIQTWAFVPRSNIYFHVGPRDEHPEQQQEEEETQQLDFNTLPEGILKSYPSSPGVIREFCPNCGATVFWHDQWRPELIDVSVGLLRAPEGSRADTWLDWWRGRVSFTEETGTQRTGVTAQRALALIQRLEEGLRDSVRNS